MNPTFHQSRDFSQTPPLAASACKVVSGFSRRRTALAGSVLLYPNLLHSVFRRIKGEVQWKLVAVRKRKFPYFDESPLAVAGTPEVREYMAIGVVNDEEIGQPSEIKEVVYAG